MVVKKKVMAALRETLKADYIWLEENDGVSGYVVSRLFEDKTSLDRQGMIDDALRELTPEEHRQVLMIAGLTPIEYESAGVRIRIHEIRQMTGGGLEILLRGGRDDAEYVRNVIGTGTTEPKDVPGAEDILMTFCVNARASGAFTRDAVIAILKADPYIEVMPNVSAGQTHSGQN